MLIVKSKNILIKCFLHISFLYFATLQCSAGIVVVAGTPKRVRPKSLAISTPTKLLSLEEAQSRAFSAIKPEQDYIEVGEYPKSVHLLLLTFNCSRFLSPFMLTFVFVP